MKVSREIQDLVPYKPGKPIGETQREFGLSNVIKLGSNENNWGVSPRVVDAVRSALKEQFRYPDPTSYELLKVLSKTWGVSVTELGVGNGSNELIDLLIRIYCEPGDFILTSERAFLAYAVCAQAARVGRLFAPLKDSWRTDLKSIAQILRTHSQKEKIRLVFLPNPNNPTGTYIRQDELKLFLDEFGNDPNRLIVFDEAYTEFVRATDYTSGMEWRLKYSNIVVLRTLSKAYGLAGFRVGVLCANTETVDYFNRVRNPFNVNDLAQVAAIAALQDHGHLRQSVQMVWDGLDYFYEELRKQNIPFVESQGNFVMFDTQRDVQKVNHALLKRGVILRPILNYGFATHLRMSVGRPDENQMAIQALREVFQEIPKLEA